MMTSPIIPAIIPQSFADLESQIAKISHLHEVHVDVVDGVFVPAMSWPYNTDNAIPATTYDLLAPFSLEVDLMVEDQWGAAEAWLRAGADQLVFHAEVISPALLEQFRTEYDVTVGIASTNDMPVAELARYFPYVDYVQVMGIAAIGTQGQPFDERVFERITQIQTEFPHMSISIDGSMNATTLPRIAPLHLSRIIVGSAIMAQNNPLESYHELTHLVQS
jgi:pentose-5-phosphate-3-epimerase